MYVLNVSVRVQKLVVRLHSHAEDSGGFAEGIGVI